MTIPIASGNAYSIKAEIGWQLGANSSALTLGLSFPACRRAGFQAVASQGAAAGAVAGAAFAGVAVPGGTGTSVMAITSGTVAPRYVSINGQLLCSGSGNLIFWVMPEVTSGLVNILDGSSIIVWNMGTVTV